MADEADEVRQALLGTLDEVWVLQAFELVWTLVVAALAWQVAGSAAPPPPWVVAWLALETLCLPLRRIGLGWPQRAGPRLLGTGLGAMAALWLGHVALTLLSCVLVVGLQAIVVARWAALPRLACTLVAVLGAALFAGLWASPLPGLRPVAAMVPVGAFAFLLLAVQNHRLLLQMLRLQFENRRLSMQDPLTGLPNRREFGERLNRLGHDGLPETGCYALLCLDLDGFKRVNDRYGHDAGDQLLAQAARRFRDALRHDDAVCRIGGDEFVVLLPGADHDSAARVAQRLLQALAQPFTLAAADGVQVGLSVGIALSPGDGCEPQQLLRQADLALYRAKRAGKGCYRWAGADEGRAGSARAAQPAPEAAAVC